LTVISVVVVAGVLAVVGLLVAHILRQRQARETEAQILVRFLGCQRGDHLAVLSVRDPDNLLPSRSTTDITASLPCPACILLHYDVLPIREPTSRAQSSR
jgi:hypothetical protein